MSLTANKIIKEVHEIAEEGFKLGGAEKFQLSLEFGDGFLVYAIFDSVSRFLKKTGKISFNFSEKKDSYASLFSELQGNADFFKQGFHSVYLTWNKSGATLVPSAFYSENKKEELLGFNFGKQENIQIITEDIKGIDVKVIYAIPTPVKLFFDTHLSNYKLKHISTALTEHLLSEPANRNEKRAFININTGNFNLLVMEKGLKFFNSFDFQSGEDILYYALFSFEQSGFDPHTDKAIIAGEVEAGSGIHQLLKHYIKNISFAVADKSIARGTKMAAVPHHYYFNTLNRFVCG
ncbi:MAG: DUF3822 family protein [Bacteroidia bacterium]|nr:DUF3822 family protein [Bacteroidia bacterium]